MRHLSTCADLLMTTSPNVMVYAAMDGRLRHMARDGKRLLGDALSLVIELRERIERLPGLACSTTSFSGMRRLTISIECRC